VSSIKLSEVSRREFVRQAGLAAGGMLLAGGGALASPHTPAQGDLPRRILGRTGVPVTVFTLGTAPAGFAKPYSTKRVADVVDAALELGVNSIDTAPKYDIAEEGVGLALGKRRKDVFLATKVWADTIQEAEQSLSQSLRRLKTDCVDLLYYHSIGHRQVDGAMAADGVFTWIVKQKKAGKTRFVGVSGHHMPGRFARFIESGEVDVVLTVVNFVDRHTYRFEDLVLPLVRKHNLGIVAMKVFGGAHSKKGSYANPDAPPQLDVEHLETAVRYALGVPGVTTLNIGCHNPQQVRHNVQMVRSFRPLSAEEQEKVETLGKQLAAQWGPHFGPVS